MGEVEILKWLLENLWLPVLGLVATLVGVIRTGDVNRIAALETQMKDTATRDDVLKVERLAQQGVEQERFNEYIKRIEEGRIETRELFKNSLLEIKAVQQRADDKLTALTERIIEYGLARDERKAPR